MKYERELKILRLYIGVNSEEPKYVISAKTGISLEIITKLIKEGYLFEEDGMVKSEKRRNYQKQGREELIQSLYVAVKHDISTNTKNNKSRLVRELDEKRKMLNDVDKGSYR